MFLETICIKKGIVQNIEAHLERMSNAGIHFGFYLPKLPNLLELVPAELQESKKVKCSVVYHKEILSITFSDYRPKRINSLKLVKTDIEYPFKFSERSVLNTLLQEKGDCDEILIVKNNFITDTSFSNVVFRKDNEFFTPDTYLLNGTKRQQLLREKKICETRITADDLIHFDTIHLINAMLDLEEDLGVSVVKII